jgi:uncharacterized membrane protein
MDSSGSTKRRNRLLWTFIGLLVLVEVVVVLAFSTGSMGTRLLWALMGAVWTAAVGYVFLFVLVAGIQKLVRQRKVEFHELEDENVVNYDPDGERKLHEYLTAITSTEARIGLIQTSEPWRGPKAADDDDKS